jgi:hypothetical protein
MVLKPAAFSIATDAGSSKVAPSSTRSLIRMWK